MHVYTKDTLELNLSPCVMQATVLWAEKTPRILKQRKWFEQTHRNQPNSTYYRISTSTNKSRQPVYIANSTVVKES